MTTISQGKIVFIVECDVTLTSPDSIQPNTSEIINKYAINIIGGPVSLPNNTFMNTKRTIVSHYTIMPFEIKENKPSKHIELKLYRTLGTIEPITLSFYDKKIAEEYVVNNVNNEEYAFFKIFDGNDKTLTALLHIETFQHARKKS